MAPRKVNGQWEKGHSGNPKGRPKRATEDCYLAILSDECGPDEWRKICRTTVSRAMAGDNVCRQWVSDYLLGKPVQRNEITGADGGPIQVATFDAALKRAYGGNDDNPA